jgi:transposase
MRKVREVLRLVLEQERSQREVGQSLGLSQSTIHEYVSRFAAGGLTWPLAPDVDDGTLEARLFRRQALPAATARAVPEWATVHRELKRKGVTLQLLWIEYKREHPDGYQYTQFCRHYHDWAATIEPVMRQVYVAGERTFVDYAGQTVPIFESPHIREASEARAAQIFVSALGASHLLYFEATWTQALPDWIAAHVRMVEYYGGVTSLTIPDNASALVRRPCYYEPELNATYQDWATHYGTAILPTRVAAPRDKAKVESAVLIVEREVLAPLRHERFTSLGELNHALSFAREQLNNRPFQKLPGSRRSVFEETERAALRPLPPTRYELADWRTAKVNIDYHIAVEGHLYSVPYSLVGARVDVRLTASMIEVLQHGKRVAAHPRSTQKGRASTDPAHRPKAHQRHLDWTPSRLIRWGHAIGMSTGRVVETVLARFPHPEQGYRSCLGLLALRRKYGDARLEAAATRALATGAVSYRSVKSILTTSLDQLSLTDTDVRHEPPLRLPATHAHVRGPAYYRSADRGEADGVASEADVSTSPSE